VVCFQGVCCACLLLGYVSVLWKLLHALFVTHPAAWVTHLRHVLRHTHTHTHTHIEREREREILAAEIQADS